MKQQLVRFDWAIKRLLRSKANFSILEGFLSELLKQDLKILNILESESNKDDHDSKYNKVDILVELTSKEIVLIEIQVNTESDYFYRMLFGASKIVTEYLKEGAPYSQIKKVYSVNILYFDLGHGDDYVYHGTTSFIGIHSHDKLDLNEKQKQLYQKECVEKIYPEYYLIKVNQFNDMAKDSLDEWIYFLKNEEIKDDFHAKGLLDAKDKLDALKLSAAEKQEYKSYLENLRYQESMADSSYSSGKIEGVLEGKAEGRIEGKAEGRIEGKAEGKIEGILEGKIEVAKKMQASGVSMELIRQITGLDDF
ncbi:MAG: Rpn family recombination-promoting nuclease/putative transposase [Gammaproteobacteria bacterium]|nr:Rpn family recombination-promoting nuclease/putative transposase [Gammaproteobacteria bacterium]